MNAATKPSTRDLADFRATMSAETDAPIRAAMDLTDALECPFATSAQGSRVRRLARECIYVATHGREQAARAAWTRLADALTSATDPSGTFHESFRVLFLAIVEPRAADRTAYRAEQMRLSDDSHLPSEFRRYYREVRAMFEAGRA